MDAIKTDAFTARLLTYNFNNVFSIYVVGNLHIMTQSVFFL